MSHTPAGTAFSYIRFSHPDQAKGDSLRRQEDKTAEYCRRRGWALDSSLTLRDLGVSAFRGKNAAVGNFRTFLDGIESGKVPVGSTLIVESFDRISRQGIDEGYDLIKRILKAGIGIVTLSPEREFDREATRGLSKGALEIQLILERAAEESERKAERVGDAWQRKRQRAVANGVPLTHRVPGWVKLVGGRFALDERNAAAVRRIYDLAIAGYGIGLITKKLNADGTPPIGRAKYWARSYVVKILSNRATFGEYQPHTLRYGARRPEGPPIAAYYPAVVTEDKWHATRAALASRTQKG